MDKAKSALSSYFKTEKIILSDTKAKIGAMIYSTGQVTDLQHLTSFVAAVNWTVTVFAPSFDATTGNKRPESIYLGPANTANQLDPDDFVARI